MTEEQLIIEDLTAKVEALTERLNQVLPIIETLGEMMLFRKMEADETFGLNKQTLSKSNRAVTQGENGTKALRFSRPGEKLRFKKSVVDKFWREKTKPAAAKAASARAKANTRRYLNK